MSSLSRQHASVLVQTLLLRRSPIVGIPLRMDHGMINPQDELLNSADVLAIPGKTDKESGTNGTVVFCFGSEFAQSAYWHPALYYKFRRKLERLILY